MSKSIKLNKNDSMKKIEENFVSSKDELISFINSGEFDKMIKYSNWQMGDELKSRIKSLLGEK